MKTEIKPKDVIKLELLVPIRKEVENISEERVLVATYPPVDNEEVKTTEEGTEFSVKTTTPGDIANEFPAPTYLKARFEEDRQAGHISVIVKLNDEFHLLNPENGIWHDCENR